MHAHAPRHAPPWLFGITAISYGIAPGFVGSTLPFLTRKAGTSVENIGWFVLLGMIPPMVQFLYAPIVDVGPRRKYWLVIVSALGGACLCAAMTMPLPSKIVPFLAFTVAGQLISGLVGSCNGGLLATTMPNELRGAAAGWLNAGNLGGSALCAWATIYMVGKGIAPLTIGLTLLALTVLPSLAALTIDEAPREKQDLGALFGGMLSDVWRVGRSRPGWTGMLLCISPVGTAALVNYFSGLAVDYHASDSMVAFVNGWASALLTAVGSLVGGYVCDRMSRRAAYLISGGLTAVCGVIMGLCPLTPMTYAVGVSAYLLVTGFCYASFSAVVLEAIGKAGAAASTQYTLFTAAGNAAIAYVGVIDTRYHHAYGPKGLLFVDAGLNVAGIFLLAIMIYYVFRQRPEEASAKAA